MPNHTLLSMDALTEGMIVNANGLRCLIDREIRTWPSQNGGEAQPVTVYSTNALVLNRDEVSGRDVPYSFTETTSYPSRGLAAEPEGTHRWGVQGASWVQVAVETTSL